MSTTPTRKRFGPKPKTLPTSEEVALRPELVRQMLEQVKEVVNEHDLEHMVMVGITTDGAPRVYHTYGKDLPMGEVRKLLADLAILARGIK